MDTKHQALAEAAEQAAAGDWQSAHVTAQAHEGDPLADWLHAIVHVMEGDLTNARYWYGRSGRAANAFADTEKELAALKAEIARVAASG